MSAESAGATVVTFGETMVTTALHGAGPLEVGAGARVSFAGAESTVAIGLARLGHRAMWCGRLGDDAPGRMIAHRLQAEGVDTSAVVVDESAPTGALLRFRRTADRVEVAYQRTGSAGSRLVASDVAEAVAGADLLHVTGITPALGQGPRQAVVRAVEVAREHGLPVSFDVNYRSRLWTPQEAAEVLGEIARVSTIVFAGPAELSLVTGATTSEDGICRLHDAGVSEVVVKDGPRGATGAMRGERIEVPAHRVTAIDPVGAGDSFVAGYLSARLDGLALRERLERATALGAWSVSCDGDWEGLPQRSEIVGLTAGDDVQR